MNVLFHGTWDVHVLKTDSAVSSALIGWKLDDTGSVMLPRRIKNHSQHHQYIRTLRNVVVLTLLRIPFNSFHYHTEII